MSAPLIYYINLDTRPDRRSFMERQLAERGLAAVRVPAVTAQEAAVLRRQVPAIAGRFTDAQVACNFSHRKAWTALIESDSPAAVVLEDDVLIGIGFENLINWSSYAPLSPTIVRLEAFLRRSRLGTHAIVPAPGFSARRMASGEPGTAAYLISRETAARSLADDRAHGLLVDAYLFGSSGPYINERRAVHVVPSPCIQAGRSAEWAADEVARSDLRPGQPVWRRRRRGLRELWRRFVAVVPWFIEDPMVFLSAPIVVQHSGVSQALR